MTALAILLLVIALTLALIGWRSPDDRAIWLYSCVWGCVLAAAACLVQVSGR